MLQLFIIRNYSRRIFAYKLHIY